MVYAACVVNKTVYNCVFVISQHCWGTINEKPKLSS